MKMGSVVDIFLSFFLVYEAEAQQLISSMTIETAQVIGPLHSLAWSAGLAGLDELVGAIDDPTYLIEDDIEVNPFGTSLLWLLERHMEEGTLPRRIWAKGSGNNPPVIPSTLITTVPATIPAAAKETLNIRNPSDLYPTS